MHPAAHFAFTSSFLPQFAVVPGEDRGYIFLRQVWGQTIFQSSSFTFSELTLPVYYHQNSIRWRIVLMEKSFYVIQSCVLHMAE